LKKKILHLLKQKLQHQLNELTEAIALLKDSRDNDSTVQVTNMKRGGPWLK
jgi:hypothetical protein